MKQMICVGKNIQPLTQPTVPVSMKVITMAGVDAELRVAHVKLDGRSEMGKGMKADPRVVWLTVVVFAYYVLMCSWDIWGR